MLPERYWPGIEDPRAYPLPNEPTNADQIAKHDRLISYRRFHTEQECLISLERRWLTSATIEIGSDWHSPLLGKIPLHPVNKLNSVHSIGLAGFDFETSEFVFPNTWGEKWGDGGLGYLPFGYLTKFMTEGWSWPATSPASLPEHPGDNIFHRGIELPGLGKEWIVEILDGDSNVMMGWAIGVQRARSFRVEELFVRPDYRRRGYGSLLANEFIKLNQTLTTPISFLIPWGDHEEHNTAALLAWARSLSLRLEPAAVRWAAYKATVGTPVDSLPKLEWIPRKATSTLSALGGSETKAVSPRNPFVVWDRKRAERRHVLIEKKYESYLTEEELDELDNLQLEFGEYQDSIAPLPPN